MCFVKDVPLLVMLIVYAGAQSVVEDPVNTTVCEGDNATFTCVFFFPSGTFLSMPGWLRDSTAVDMMRHTITSNLTGGTAPPVSISSTVTVSSVTVQDDDEISYKCGIASDSSIAATLNVVAPPMTAPTINTPTMLSSRSFTVSWTITDPDHNYIVTWTNLRTGMMSSVTVPENTNSYMVTGLNGVDNYNVSVTANNSCGMMMSDLITVYDVPNAVVNVRVMDEDTTSESFVVQWNEVTDYFTVNYTVTWYNESRIVGMVTVNSPPYTVTGLINNTSYNVTVVAINTCCGAGPVSNVIVAMTNMREPTPSPSPSPTSTNNSMIISDDDDDDPTVIIIVVCVMVIVLIIITIIIILVVYRIKRKKWPCTNKDSNNGDMQELKSPTSTSEGHKMGKASVQPTNVPHQTAASGEEYAVTTKVAPRSQQQQQPAQEYAVVDKSKKHSATTQGITYADLQQLPSSGNVPSQNQGPTSTYAMVA